MKKPNIDYVSVLDGIKSISARNEAFDKLDDQSKRLEIAWDALKLTKRGIITASNGCYWGIKLGDVQFESSTSKDFQRRLNKTSNFKGCSVCARGAIMLSLIRLGNNIKPDIDYGVDNGSEQTVRGFSMQSMKNMENEYELSTYNHPYRINTDEKLMNILCNVLVNGDFNTKDTTDYLI